MKKKKELKEKKLEIKTELVPLELEALAAEVEVCPECGMTDSIVIVGHCKTCMFCGWSLCSL